MPDITNQGIFNSAMYPVFQPTLPRGTKPKYFGTKILFFNRRPAFSRLHTFLWIKNQNKFWAHQFYQEILQYDVLQVPIHGALRRMGMYSSEQLILLALRYSLFFYKKIILHLYVQDSLRSHLRHHVEIELEIAESRKNTALAVLQLQHPVVANTNTGEVCTGVNT